MYLKTIEMQGFKSFAQRIQLNFESGITGIVGPNGSGKSNVADAVRWVLGEQSAKQLRSANMQDVIFSGTETRKPQGYAYVAITFDNSDRSLGIDYDQVVVSRRVYRSGESEYRINGNLCRLREVNELFYDTGIGKEGYSIIGQGQIDKILSGKPEERRELFDEAAGIVKFKKRKNIAVKKLENETQNMLRVSDILAELEKQTGPLERQAAKAREYLRLREDLKELDVNLFLLDTEELKKQQKKLEDDTFIVEGDLLEARSQAEQIKSRYDHLTKKNEELEKKIEETRTSLNEEQLSSQNMEGQIKLLEEQIRSEQLQEEHLRNRRQTLQKDAAGRKEQIKEALKDKEELEKDVKSARKDREETQRELNRREEYLSSLDEEMARDKDKTIEHLNTRASLTAKIQRYEAMLEQAGTRKSEISGRMLKVKSEEEILKQSLKEAEEKAQNYGEELKKLKEEMETSLSQEEKLQASIRNLSGLISRKEQEFHKYQSRQEYIRNMAERYEGYGGSIRRVMEQKKNMPGIIGVVADLITVEKKYETAIETALGGAIQNIVTDTQATAKRMIEFLKKNQYGRATFLPLEAVRERGGFAQPEALKEPGVLGTANTLVSVKAEAKELAGYLLGKILVVDQMDHGISIARKYHYSFRIVTLEGELLNTGGSMTGGAYKNSSNLLGRKREIEELEKQMETSGREWEELKGELAAAQRRAAQLGEAGKKNQERMQSLSLEHRTCTMNIVQTKEKLGELRAGSKDLSLELGQLEEQTKQAAKAREELLSQVSWLEEKNRQIEQETKGKAVSLEKGREERDELNKALSQAALRLSEKEQRLTFVNETLDRLRQEIARFRQEEQELEGGQESAEDLIKDKKLQIEGLREAIKKLADQQQFGEEKLGQLVGEKEKNSREQKGFFEQREAVSERIASLDKESYRLSQTMLKLEEQLDRYVEYLWTEYELTPSAAKAMGDGAYESIPELKKGIDEKKSQIKNLGNVNVNAIEDFKEVSERYAFLKNQYEDLTAARENLTAVIEELDKGMKQQFEEKFAQIKQEFDRVFKELFGGGHGTLELTDEDILESGIGINAQPPGKKLQNMMQLSGGEKALTAICLLFAIQNLKPSPFCLLDEIEAALDDPNVTRFARYLRKLKKNTQFIVITHRRGTMLLADQLYGITMQEKGVSSLVSVDLTDAAGVS